MTNVKYRTGSIVNDWKKRTRDHIVIRPGRIEDAVQSSSIFYAAFKANAERHNVPNEIAPPDNRTVLHWSERISHPGYYAVVAELDGHIVGSHFLDERDPIAGVGPLTVDASVQDNRIGRRLMEAVLPGQLRNGTAELTDVKQANSPQLNGRALLSIGRN